MVAAAGARRQVDRFPVIDVLTDREREVAIVDAARARGGAAVAERFSEAPFGSGAVFVVVGAPAAAA